nr:hypothetical protein [Methylomarinum sp. Ch1-1]MDP4519386.1 hypothetical protein [Methylomarinum sp. Ch1-1]
MADNDLDSARLYVSKDSEDLLQAPERNLQEADFAVGQIVINDTQARVETVASFPDNTQSSFSTFLIKEGDDWRIDYRRTRYSLSGNLFNGLFDSLKNIGENLNKQLEQQMPQIEKEMESFGQELQKQLDNLGKELEKSFPPPKQKPDPYQDSI